MNDRMFENPVFVRVGNSLIQEMACLEDALEFLYEWPKKRRARSTKPRCAPASEPLIAAALTMDRAQWIFDIVLAAAIWVFVAGIGSMRGDEHRSRAAFTFVRTCAAGCDHRQRVIRRAGRRCCSPRAEEAPPAKRRLSIESWDRCR
jgi:hypothetical protein